MFWRFGGHANISTLDTILDKPDVTLEEILDESDLIQELKQHNTKLIEFLGDDDVLRKLLEYVIAPKPAETEPKSTNSSEGGELSSGNSSRDDGEYENETGRPLYDSERDKQEKTRLKYAYVACEVLSSEAWSLSEALMENQIHLRNFWAFLDRPAPLDPLQAGYFTKVNETLLDKKTEEMLDFFRSLEGIVPKMLKHVDCQIIMDLLLKIISMEKCEGGAGIVDWLYTQNLMPLLLSFLSPEYPATKQTSSGDLIKAIITISANASQNEASCIGPNDLTRQLVSEKCVQDLINDMLKGGNPLTVGVGIVIEVIRKNNSDYDPDVGGADSIPSSRDPIYLGTLLKLFAQNVPNFMDLITQSYTVLNEDGTRSEKKRELKAAFGGTIEPLGFDRFKTCELMAELLHCSNMGLLNEKGGERYIRERDRERDRLRADRERENFSAEGGSECNGGNEGVVVEKAPLQVQNGGIETEEDAMNEDEFEDVAVSALLDEVREGRQSKAEDKERQSGDIKEVEENKTRKEAEARKSTEEEDLFVDEPLSPPASPYNDSKASETVEAKPTSPSAPARILADNIPPLDVTPIPGPPQDGGVSVSPTSSGLTAGFGGLGVQDDSKVEEFKPPVPEKDRVDEKTKTGASKEVVKDASKDVSGETAKEHAIEEGPEEKATTEDILKSDVPRAPSPPPTEGDDDTKPIKGANPLIADLNSPSTPPPLQAQAAQSVPITIERLNADVPPLPQEAEQPQNPFEEDLMDITAEDLPPPPPKPFVNVTPIGSSIDEYECMIERDLDGNPVVGDLLKIKFVEHRVVPTILEFFFRFPWNNFLHNVVYDVVQQVFNGPMERGYNRALAIDLFLTGRITERIVEGQRMSDKVQAEKNMRLGYMGHLTLIAEEVVKFTERHAAELLGQKVLDKVIDHSWIDYVEETLAATRERDNAILGGIRPDMALGPRQAVLNAVQAQAFNGNSNTGSLMLSGGGSSALDSIDLANGNAGLAGVGSSGGAGGLLSGFGSSSDEEDDDIMEHDDDDEVSRLGLSGSSDQFATYISQEITNVDKFGSSDEDEDDDVISFSTAPSEPPPPPPPTAPLNVRGAVSSLGFEEIEEVDSSDDEDELMGGSLLARRRPITHEAATREMLDDDDEEFITAGIRGLRMDGYDDEDEDDENSDQIIGSERK